MESNVQLGVWPCVTTRLKRGSLRKGRVGGWGCWGGGGSRSEREREVYSCSLLNSDVCFPTHLRLGLPSIFWCCIPCSECCNLLCVGLNVHNLGKISYFICQLQVQGMCSSCIVGSLKHL